MVGSCSSLASLAVLVAWALVVLVAWGLAGRAASWVVLAASALAAASAFVVLGIAASLAAGPSAGGGSRRKLEQSRLAPLLLRHRLDRRLRVKDGPGCLSQDRSSPLPLAVRSSPFSICRRT